MFKKQYGSNREQKKCSNSQHRKQHKKNLNQGQEKMSIISRPCEEKDAFGDNM